MKTYINRRPPWVWPQPEYQLYVVLSDAEAEQVGKDSLLMRRQIHDHANKVMIKHSGVASVPFYDVRGQLLKVISREE